MLKFDQTIFENPTVNAQLPAVKYTNYKTVTFFADPYFKNTTAVMTVNGEVVPFSTNFNVSLSLELNHFIIRVANANSGAESVYDFYVFLYGI